VTENFIQTSRAGYFKEIFSRTRTVRELIEFFYCFTGPIYEDQTRLLLEEINRQEAGNSKYNWQEADLFAHDTGLGARACAEIGKRSDDLYFAPTHQSVFTWKLFASNKNELRSLSIPYPLCQRLPFQDRPEFNLYHIPADAIFLTPNSFFAFNRANKSYWPLASTRCFPRFVAEKISKTIKGPAVLIQDLGDGTNFSHFLFDWMLRLVLFCERVGNARDYTFIMGGQVTAFHKEVMTCVREWLGLPESCFFWPERGVTLGLPEGIFVFSDSKENSLHPAYMAHEYGMNVIKTIAGRLKIEPAAFDRVYISRGDAALRRIAEEGPLVERLAAMNYKIIRLSELNMREQFSVVAGAKSIIAPHGMGLTHIALRDGPLDLLELFHPRFGTDAYAFIAGAKKYCHAHLVGRELGDEKGSYEVDVDKVVAFSRMMT
jgi:hypothetical protein